MVHSLNSVNYLKIEESNMIQFDKAVSKDDKCEVTIQEQHYDQHGNTYYDKIFMINMEEMDLTMLILVQSIFMLDSSSRILELIDL